MNSTNKKSPGARGVPQSFNRQAGHATQNKPVVTQLKTLVPAHRVKTPIGPPAFSPLAAQKAAQPKMANGYANRGTIQRVQCGECFQFNSHSKNCSKRNAPQGGGGKNQQSLQDRNVNNFLRYQTPNKKTVEQDVQKVKKLKTTIAHGSRNRQHGQSGKTKKILNNL